MIGEKPLTPGMAPFLVMTPRYIVCVLDYYGDDSEYKWWRVACNDGTVWYIERRGAPKYELVWEYESCAPQEIVLVRKGEPHAYRTPDE